MLHIKLANSGPRPFGPATLEHIARQAELAILARMDESTFVAGFCALTIFYVAAWIALERRLIQATKG